MRSTQNGERNMAAYGGGACEASHFCAPATLTTRPAADCVFGGPAHTQAQNVGVSGIDRYVARGGGGLEVLGGEGVMRGARRHGSGRTRISMTRVGATCYAPRFRARPVSPSCRRTRPSPFSQVSERQQLLSQVPLSHHPHLTCAAVPQSRIINSASRKSLSKMAIACLLQSSRI